ITTTASSNRKTSPCWLAWNACAVPEKPVLIVDGRVCRAAFCTSFTAAPRDTPGGRLNERVTDGSWPLWFTLRGPTSFDAEATEVSGISLPVCDRRYSSWSADGSRWYSGSSSRMTQYWLFGV